MHPNHTTEEIPYGYCHCGCGKKTKIAAHNHTASGTIKGNPSRFLKGHHPQISIEERFWKYVTPGPFNECWVWQGPTHDNGYGRLNAENRRTLAHRYSYEIHNGPIPEGMLVCHHCDNPACCNPYHFFLGTINDNNQDMIAKGRQRPRIGNLNGNAKLSVEHVQEIRKSVSEGVPQNLIAKQFAMSKATINRIVKRKLWRHVP